MSQGGQLDVDVAVIGGGPAAMAFCTALADTGLNIAVIDEQPRPGGQILRQPPADFEIDNWLPGSAYRGLKRQLARFEALKNVRWIGGSAVLGLDRQFEGFELCLDGASGTRIVRARRVLTATGCYDLAAAFPGWTLPGVMTAGGVQTLLKSQQVLAGERIVFCGTHPLQLIVADQVMQNGGRVEAVVFVQSFHAAWRMMFHHTSTMLANMDKLVDAATALARLKRRGVPVRFGEVPERAIGYDRLEGVTLRAVEGGGAPVHLTCDTLALCFGFAPQSDLPRSLDAAIAWDEPYGGWRILHDVWMRSSVDGLFVAGETAGVGGAQKALIEGELAALGCAGDAGVLTPEEAEQRAKPLRRAHGRALAFAAMLRALTDPGEALRKMVTAETVVCRCEIVRHRDIDAALREHVQVGRPNAVKLLTRAGMGGCGGRNCEPAVVRQVSQSLGRLPEPQDAFTARFPARSTPVSRLI